MFYIYFSRRNYFWKFSNELFVVVFTGKVPSTKFYLKSISDNFHFDSDFKFALVLAFIRINYSPIIYYLHCENG